MTRFAAYFGIVWVYNYLEKKMKHEPRARSISTNVRRGYVTMFEYTVDWAINVSLAHKRSFYFHSF